MFWSLHNLSFTIASQERSGLFVIAQTVSVTIQRVSKAPGGHYLGGATRNACVVAEFEFLYHEIGSITNVFNFVATNHPMKHKECHI